MLPGDVARKRIGKILHRRPSAVGRRLHFADQSLNFVKTVRVANWERSRL